MELSVNWTSFVAKSFVQMVTFYFTADAIMP